MGYAEDEVTPFLKARRAALDPVALGLPDGLARRRVSGLRREEVAQLAGISVDYYTRIEQGRAQAVSDAVLDAIARALRLTANEHSYLRNITQPRRRPAECTAQPAPRPRVRPQIQELLDAMNDTVPAMVFGPGTDILAWNRLAGRLTFDFAALPEAQLNSALLVFTHPDARSFYPDWEATAEEIVASLRVEDGQYPDEPRVQQVICELRDASPEFVRCWEERAVRERNHGTKRIQHPEVGELVVTYEAFTLPADPEQRLCTYTAAKGSVTEERLRTLALGVAA